MARIKIPHKGYGAPKGAYRFRFRSWEVVTILFTVPFGSCILTGVTATDEPLSARIVAGVIGGSLWAWGIGLLVRRLIRGRNHVTLYERGMIVSNRRTGAVKHSFSWTDVATIYEHGHAASSHGGQQAADPSNRVWLTLKNGETIKFINTLTDMEMFSHVVRAYVAAEQKAALFAEWKNSGELRAGRLLLTAERLIYNGRFGVTTVEWSQVMYYTCGTEALQFTVPTTPSGKSTQLVKISWSGLPNLGVLDMLIKHILGERGRS